MINHIRGEQMKSIQRGSILVSAIHSSSGKAYGVTISKLDKGFYKDKFRWAIRKID